MAMDFQQLLEYLDKRFSGMEQQFSELRHEFGELRGQFDVLQSAVEGYANRADGYFWEMVMLAHKVNRHERGAK